jgi:hypothetical protein
MGQALLRTEDLRPDDQPIPSNGWDGRTLIFAESFDGYEYVRGGPQELDANLLTLLREALDRTGRVPHAYLIDDLRAVMLWLTRADRHGDWSPGRGGVEFRLYVAAIDRMRYLLHKRAGAGRSTPAGRGLGSYSGCASLRSPD